MGHSDPVRAQLMSLSTVVTSKPRTVGVGGDGL
jgi:hypothetical protein